MPITITPTPPIGARPYDAQINKYQRINPIGSMLVDSPTREIGGGFASALDTVAITVANSGAGSSVTVANSIATLTSGTANSGYATGNTNAIARFTYSTANFFRGNFRLVAIGGANTTRSWGAFNFGTKPAIQDGFFFSYDGSSSALSVNIANGGVTTSIASGSFNGEVASYTVDTNVHAYEIIYQLPAAWFFIDGVLIHKFKATTSMMSGSMHLPVASLSKNSVSGTISASLEVWAANISKMTSNEPDPQFFHISTNTTSVIKLGPGTLQRVVISSPGGTNNTATIYDNTAGSGTIIAVINAAGGSSPSSLLYNLPFATGLTIVTATGTAADLTIVYD